jgi:hypothetical protein
MANIFLIAKGTSTKVYSANCLFQAKHTAIKIDRDEKENIYKVRVAAMKKKKVWVREESKQGGIVIRHRPLIELT